MEWKYTYMILVKSAIFQLNAISHRCVFSLERTVQTDANQRFGTFKQVAQGYSHISKAHTWWLLILTYMKRSLGQRAGIQAKDEQLGCHGKVWPKVSWNIFQTKVTKWDWIFIFSHTSKRKSILAWSGWKESWSSYILVSSSGNGFLPSSGVNLTEG